MAMAISALANDNSNPYPVTLSLAMLFYNEEACVETVVREAHEVLQRTGESFELVAIQNGSLDSTPQILTRLVSELPELRILVIPVNKGAGYGARKGWYDCRGRYVMGVSGDGQVDLQVIPAMFQLLRETGSEMAYGKRRTRPDGAHRAVVSTIYRALMRLAFGIDSQDMNGLPKILHHKALQKCASSATITSLNAKWCSKRREWACASARWTSISMPGALENRQLARKRFWHMSNIWRGSDLASETSGA